MLDQLLKIEISASAVTWYAASIATVSMFLSLLNHLRDRSRIKIKYMKDAKVIGVPGIYDLNKTYFNITVTNKGRRPIKIEKAALKIVDKKGFFLLSDSFSAHRKQLLTEEDPRTEFMVDQTDLDFSKIAYIAVYDGTDRQHKKYLLLFPTFLQFFYWLKS